MLTATTAGFLTSLSLILAIGAQNAFVLRHGIRREHITVIIAVCALSDSLLIALGVGGFRLLGPHIVWLAEVMRWGGVGFLVAYGAMRFHAAWRGGEALLPANAPPTSLTHVLVTCLVITFANPHVYLDTVMLIGSISAQYQPYEIAFGVGAAFGSMSFFSMLGYGARMLAPILASVRSWIILEVLIGLTMWSIAAALIFKSA